MKKLLISLTALFLVASALAESTIKIGDRQFTLAHVETGKDGNLKEFVLNSEKIDNWSELVAVREFMALYSAEKYIRKMAAEYKKRFPSVQFAIFEKKETGEWVIDYVIFPKLPTDKFIEWNYFQAGKNPLGPGIVVNQFASRRPLTGTTEEVLKSWNLGAYRANILPVLMKSRFTIQSVQN